MTKYKMLQDQPLGELIAGEIVYSCVKPDYGLARDDSYDTGIEHISITRDPNGDYPFITVPEHLLEIIE